MVKRRPKPDVSKIDALRDAREAHLALLRHPTDKNAAEYRRARQEWLEVSGRHNSTHLPTAGELLHAVLPPLQFDRANDCP
jgi:hypothetical protein